MATPAAHQLSEPRSRALDRVEAAGLERAFAVAGLVVIALHVLDDRFIQPQPGTSA
jgi:hypothetical protein